MKLSDVSRTDLTNTDVQSTKLTLNLNPLLFLNTFSLTLTILNMQLILLEKIHSSRDSVTLEPHGLNRRDELLLSIFFLFYSFLVFCVVRNFRLSLLNNFYCKILHLYNIVIPRKFSNICKPREEGWYGQPKYCYGRTIHFVLNQLCSSLWTSRFWFLTLRLIRSLF